MSGLTQIINGGAIVSGVNAGKTNKGISDFNNIPMRRVKKHKKDYNHFIKGSNSPEAYDIPRKIHKRCSDAHDHDIVARLQELVDTDPSKSMRAMARELEVLAPWFIRRTTDTKPMTSEKVSLCRRRQNYDGWRRQTSS